MVRKTPVPWLLEWLEPATHGAATGCAAVCVDTLRHALLTTDLSKHAGAAEDAAVALAASAQRVDSLTVLTPEAIDATPALPLIAPGGAGRAGCADRGRGRSRRGPGARR